MDLLISGGGRAPQQRDAALVEQLVRAALRRRRILARTALTNQLLGTLDLVFPGLDGCFDDLLGTRVGPSLVRELADPDRLHRLGVTGLQAFVARRGVRLTAAKAAVLHQAATDALRLPQAERACRTRDRTADLSVLDLLNARIGQAEQHLAQVLPATPAGVLTSLPGVEVVRASNYGAALGDPARFGNADQAYRASGLVPASYESAGRARRGQGISRESNADLRNAIIELGRRRAQRDSDFARYRSTLAGRMKPLQAAIAVGHRAHRLAFAFVHGEPYNPTRLADSVATGGARRSPRRAGPSTNDREAACRHDVTYPPAPTLPQPTARRKTPVRT